MLATLCAVTVLIGNQAQVSAAQKLEVRAGQISLVPPEPLALGGYTERQDAKFQPGGQDLLFRVRELRQGDRRLVIGVAEMLTMPESLVREVRRRVISDPQAPAGSLKNPEILLIATHTHCAPDSQMLNDRMTFRIPGIAGFNRRWLAWYADRMAEGIAATAASTPGPAKMTLQQAPAAFNRGRRTGAQPDPLVTRLGIGVTIYAAHPTIFSQAERTLQGDWPGQLMQQSGDLVVTGAIGDVSPAADPLTPQETALQRSNRMAEGLQAALKSAAVRPLAPQWAVARVPITLGPPTPHPEFAKNNSISPEIAQILVGRFAPPQAELFGLRIGRVVMIGVPGEPTAAVARRIGIPFIAQGQIPIVISHANGWAGYMLEPDDYARGGYEATLAFHGPDLALRLGEAANGLARGLPPTQR
jgi:neutral ceramidase